METVRDISRYSEPVIWKTYSDVRPAERGVPMPDTSFDAHEASRRALVGMIPALIFVGVVGGVFSWLPLAVVVVGWLHLGVKELFGVWTILLLVGLVYVWRVFHTETQKWLAKLEDQADAAILYMQSRVPASVQVDSEAAPVIHARPVQGGYTAREYKVARLAYWVKRAIENKGNTDGKPGPRLMRHNQGEYSVTIPVTREQVDQKQQQADYTELVNLGFLALNKNKYQIKDSTWTIDQAAELLEEALGE